MWSDEMVTFWLSDPSINLNETLNRIFISHFFTNGFFRIQEIINFKIFS